MCVALQGLELHVRAHHAHLDCTRHAGTNRISLHPATTPPLSGVGTGLAVLDKVLCFRATSAYKTRLRRALGMQPPPTRRLVKKTPYRSKAFKAQQGLMQAAEQGRFWHTTSVMPMSGREVLSGFDSDDEESYDAFKARLQQRLEEVKDATPCERRFMFYWTCFCYVNPVHADCQLPELCEVRSTCVCLLLCVHRNQKSCIITNTRITQHFVKTHAAELRGSVELRQSLALHLLNLLEHHVIDTNHVAHCIQLAEADASDV